ncbi:uncharacterized protein LOC110454316 [Mizuhopecten yessoensis]|uniref:AAA+ ATPase domain-containing protein n=1 Tax=Mizuhopecten yessoensis TaxID=6573 RepID=A0A210QFI7_MIZYE|nr:uncharacterized protein LOC110454316 [Mizuhopecten yessoensis]OWF47469.1 hypothetical protein KP79_PYT07702 [Mizuhopecten yessoensis]
MAALGRTKVQSWDIIRHDLIEEFDTSPLVFDQVLECSETYMHTHGGNLPPQNGQEYFDRLEGKLTKLNMLDFLITVMEQLNVHTDMGTVCQDKVLRGYREKLEECQRAEMEDEEENKNFVGREKYIDDIVKMFEDDRNKYKGVCIRGMGGLGKTTLANQICRKLKGEWRVVKVDLREVLKLRDMLMYIFKQLTCQTLIRGEEEDILERIKEFLRKDNAIECKTILMLDNIEDVMDGEGTNRFLKDFFDKFINFIGEFGDKCKMRLLLTSRLSLFDHPRLSGAVRTLLRLFKGHDRVYGLIVEKEILPFEASEALKLFEKSIGENQIDTIQRERIVELCGYSPIAITILCKSMCHDGLTPESIIQDLGQNFWLRRILRTPNVAGCLEKSFESLNQCAKKNLIRLSVFHSAPFDIFAAADVLRTTATRFECKNEPTPKEKLDILKLRSFIEISEHEDTVRYSLHPLVFHLLKGKVKSKQFKKDFQIAKERFVEYFRKEICEVAKKMDKDCRKGNMVLENNMKHVKNFYEFMATDDLQELVITKPADSMTTIVESRRIYEIADILLYDDTKWSLIQNAITKTKASEENQLRHFFWRVCEIALLLDLDRNQEAKKKIDSLDKLLSPTLREMDDMAMAAVQGSLFFQMGRYFRKEYDCEKALHYLELAEKGIREVGTDHKILLSKIYNVMGGSEYRKKKPDYKLAREFHERALQIIIVYTNRRCFNIETPEYLQNIGTCLFKDGESLRKRGKEKEAEVKYQEAIKRYDVAIQLDKQMKLDKMECHAQILQNRGEVYCALECWDKAEGDLKHSMSLRQMILSPPHRQLTLVLFKTAQLLYKKGVWLYHKGDKDHARESMLLGKGLCEKISDLTINGGLPVTDGNYSEVKELTFKLLGTLQEHQTSKLIRNKYRKFEKGAFDKQISKTRSIGKSHFTQNQKYSRTWREPTDKAHCDSDSSSDDDDDDDDHADDDGDGDYDSAHLSKMSEREKAVDLTGVTYVGNARFIRNTQKYLFQVVLKESGEEENEEEEGDIDIEARISALIDNIDMIYFESCKNGNNTNGDDSMRLNIKEEDNTHRRCSVGENGDLGNSDTSIQGRTVSPMDVGDCVIYDSTKPIASARVLAGVTHTDTHREQNVQASCVAEPAPLEYNMDNDYAFAASEQVNRVNNYKSSASLLLEKPNVDLILKGEDTDTDEIEPTSIKQKKRKRSLNQEVGKRSSLMNWKRSRRYRDSNT